MSKIAYISYLAENNMRDELIEEVGNIEMADGFLEAHKQMRKRKNEPAFKVLNNIHDEMQRENTKRGEK